MCRLLRENERRKLITPKYNMEKGQEVDLSWEKFLSFKIITVTQRMLLVYAQVIQTTENIYAAPAHRTAVDLLLQLPV